jgi:anti-anti-sigma factor
VTAQLPRPREDRAFGIAVRADGAELTGELDVTGIDELWTALDGLVEAGRRIQVDLSRLAFLDAAGLGTLVRADRRLREVGGRLVLTGVRAGQRRLLEITGLDRLLVTE